MTNSAAKEELSKQLEKVDWPIENGSVRIRIREGKATLITIEKTIKLD